MSTGVGWAGLWPGRRQKTNPGDYERSPTQTRAESHKPFPSHPQRFSCVLTSFTRVLSCNLRVKRIVIVLFQLSFFANEAATTLSVLLTWRWKKTRVPAKWNVPPKNSDWKQNIYPVINCLVGKYPDCERSSLSSPLCISVTDTRGIAHQIITLITLAQPQISPLLVLLVTLCVVGDPSQDRECLPVLLRRFRNETAWRGIANKGVWGWLIVVHLLLTRANRILFYLSTSARLGDFTSFPKKIELKTPTSFQKQLRRLDVLVLKNSHEDVKVRTQKVFPSLQISLFCQIGTHITCDQSELEYARDVCRLDL